MSKLEARKFATFYAAGLLVLILQTSMTTLEARNHACDVSRITAKVVENCPNSEEKWREAAARKNCAAYSSQCTEPERLVYHCVINPYVNQTLEVCAYAQNIVLGYCTYFSGSLILPNFRTNCKAFLKNPCPDVYRSSEAYKYQGCYELTKNKTDLIKIKIDSSTTNAASIISTEKSYRNGNEKDLKNRGLALSLALFGIGILLIGFMLLRGRICEIHKNYDDVWL